MNENENNLWLIKFVKQKNLKFIQKKSITIAKKLLFAAVHLAPT